MATEKVIPYTIDVTDSIRNVGQLKAVISDLKKQLNDVNQTEEQNQKTLQQLTVAQNSLNEVLRGTDKSMEQVIDDNKALVNGIDNLDNSYNSLVKQMAVLQKQWRATNDEAERASLGTQIKDLNDRLKTLDASIGNYKRNVGNYQSALDGVTKGFKATAGGAGNLINPIKSVTGGFQALSATPVIAILGLLANIINQVISKMKDSEQATDRLTKALAPFNVAGQLMQKVIEKIVNALASLFEWLGDLAKRFKIFGKDTEEMMETERGFVEEEQRLEDLRNENEKKNADDRLKIAQLRNKAEGEDRNNLELRKKELEEAKALEDEISRRNYEMAKREWELQANRNKQAKTSQADLDKEAQLYAKMVDAETEYYNKTRRIEWGLASVRDKEAKQAIQNNEEVAQSTFDRQKVEMDLLKQDIELAEEGSYEKYQLQLDYANRMYKLQVEQAKKEIEDEDLLNHALENLKAQHLNEQLRLTEEYDQHLADIDAQKAAEAKAAADAAQKEEEARLAEDQLRRENDILALEEGSMERLQKELELKQYELDTLHKLEGESEEQFRNRQLKAEEAVLKAKKAITAKKVAVIQGELSATQSVMSGIEGLLNASGKSSAAAAKALKAVKIGQASVEIIQGAISAYNMAQGVYPPPLGQIMGAMQAAIVAATGAANIAKMKSTEISDGGSGGSAPTPTVPQATVATPAAVAPILGDVVGSTSVLTGASGEDWLNQMTKQRVYILSSDLEANSRRVEVQAAETSF